MTRGTKLARPRFIAGEPGGDDAEAAWNVLPAAERGSRVS